MSNPLAALIPQIFVRTAERPGVPADQPALHGQVEGLVDGLANALRELHTTDVSQHLSAIVPEAADVAWVKLRDEIRESVESGNVDVGSLPDPYSRYEAAALFEIWIDAKPDPLSTRVVLCHGNPTLDAFYFDGADLVGITGIEQARLGDRHLDLAIVQHEIHSKLGPEAVFRFYEAYGDDPNLLSLDHYLLGSFLRR